MTDTKAPKAQFSTKHNVESQRRRKTENLNKKRATNKDKFVYTPNHTTNYTGTMNLANIQNFNQLLGNMVLKEEIIEIKPIQNKNTNGTIQRRFKVIAVVGDYNGHIGIGFKSGSDIADAIKDAKMMAKLSVIPVIRGSWDANDSSQHTIKTPVIGKFSSIEMKLMPAPKGAGIVACSMAKKLLEMAGFKDVFTSSTGRAKSTFHYLIATLKAIQATYQIQILLAKQCQEDRNMSHRFPLMNGKIISSPNDNMKSRFNLQLSGEIIQ